MSAGAGGAGVDARARARLTDWLTALVAGDERPLDGVDEPLLRLLHDLRLVPLAAYRGGAHPELERLRLPAFVAGVSAQRAADAAVGFLAAAGVASVTLKGPAFAVQVLGDAAQRGSVDVDLLIRRADLPAARAAMAAAGFAGELHYPAWYEERWHDHAAFGGEVAGRHATVEVHWDVVRPRLARLPVDELIGQAETVDCGAARLPAPPLPWQLVVSAAHAAQHVFDARGVLDVALVARLLTGEQWEAALSAARRARLGPAVYYAVVLSAAWLGWQPPEGVAALAPGRARDAAARAYLGAWSPWTRFAGRGLQLSKAAVPLCVSDRQAGVPALLLQLTDRPNVCTRLDAWAARARRSHR